ncbi:MAG: AmmeMemoRadiSam system protein B [Dehalococcoidales bacterium]|nr:AmmeMemoRadiSam system protein B [Dehalococcoidales bacterium]
MIRKPAVAGQFYPAEAAQLKSLIAGLVDETEEKQTVIGLMSPHAGYPYSGPVAGATISRVKLRATCIILGPSHTGMGKHFAIMTSGSWQTPLGEVAIDGELAGKILAASSHLEEDAVAHQYEHSLEVQLPFLQYFRPDIRIVPIVLSQGDGEIYKEIGRELAEVIKNSGKEVIILASSDMTHYESQESAEKKDRQAIDAVLNLDEDSLLKRVARLDISMCGYAPVVAMLAAAKALGADKAELVKYQTSGDTTGDYSSVVGYAGILVKKESLPPIVQLARKTVETYVREGKVVPPPAELTPEMKEKAGVFVSIHKLGDLRGCIGTFAPTQKNVAKEVITNAVSAATQDPRFLPITADELADLDYSVDVLTAPVPVEDAAGLDPKKQGVIVECGWRRGLLLPDLEGVDTVEDQISICRQKAGIEPDEPVNLYCFEVKRYK